MTFRPVAAIAEATGKRLTRNPVSPPPKIAWLNLDQLVIDESYQRSLSGNGMRLIRKLVETWDWNCFKPLSVAPVGDGKYEVIDGQHTAIAAATHGAIETLPCLVLTADTVAQRSAAFVGINRDRVALTAFALFRARVAAGDEEAVAVDAALCATGCNLVETIQTRGEEPMPAGTLACVSSLLIAVRAVGQKRLERVLRICIDAELSPIPATAIKGIADLVMEGTLPDALIVQALGEVDADTLNEQVRERVRVGRAPSGQVAVIQIIMHHAEGRAAA